MLRTGENWRKFKIQVMIDSIIVGASSLLFATQNYLGGGRKGHRVISGKCPRALKGLLFSVGDKVC